MANKTDIVLDGIGKSTLLKEVSRAFLHTGCPSAMLHYIAEGIKLNVAECESEEDKALLMKFQKEVTDMKVAWARRELDYYATPFTSGEG
jgi:hypothetical protein